MFLDAISALWPSGHKITIKSGPSAAPPTELLSHYQGAEIYGAREIESTSSLRSPLQLSEDYDSFFEPIRVFEERDYELIITLPMPVSQARKLFAESKNSSWPFINLRNSRIIRIISSSFWIESNNSTQIPAILNPGSYVGSIDISIVECISAFRIEVMSDKINFESEFKYLISDIAQHHINLVYDLSSSSGLILSQDASHRPDLITTLFHFRRIMRNNELPTAIEYILNSPLSHLETTESNVQTTQAKNISANLLSKNISKMDFVKRGNLSRFFKGYSPTFVTENNKHDSVNTPENRFVLNFLYKIEEVVSELKHTCLKENKKQLAQEVDSWISHIADWKSSAIWHSVGRETTPSYNSQRLQRAEGYRDIFRYNAEINEALKLPWNDIQTLISPDTYGEIKPIYKLYEYWCYFVIRKILSDNYEICHDSEKSLFTTNNKKLSVQIRTDTDNTCTLFRHTDPNTDAYIYLFYNKKFYPRHTPEWGDWSGSYSVQFDPDISIAIKSNNLTHWLNFDAKYKLNKDLWNTNHDKKTHPRRGYIQEDLNKMHCYRDAILGSRGAYILYPGAPNSVDTLPYVRQKFPTKNGIDFPSVGHFCLRPGDDNAQTTALAYFITHSIHKLASISTYQEELGGTHTINP